VVVKRIGKVTKLSEYLTDKLFGTDFSKDTVIWSHRRSGKTEFLVNVAKRVLFNGIGKSCLIIVHNRDMVDHYAIKLKERLAGRVQTSVEKGCNFIMASQSNFVCVTNKPAINNYDVVLVDEAKFVKERYLRELLHRSTSYIMINPSKEQVYRTPRFIVNPIDLNNYDGAVLQEIMKLSEKEISTEYFCRIE